MKIHNNAPIGGKATRKTTQSSTSGVFGQLLDAGVQPSTSDQSHPGQSHSDHPNADQSHSDPSQSDRSAAAQSNPPQSNQAQVPMQEAWHTLQESVSLLDEAMHCIEAGDSPPQKLIQDIEQLRALLRQQVSSGSAATELKQADTLLAVEAGRIRAMQS
ncbi:MAG: hypothetical protein Q9M16_09110 [Mariprofundus sp.]|nr:hypothetical protein [Mariprofundus sp.]